MTKDINTILQSQVWNIGNKEWHGKRVMQMNQRELTDICKSYGFTNFLTSSTSQQKLAKTQKKLGIEMHGVALAPHTLGGDETSVSAASEAGTTVDRTPKVRTDNVDVCSNATPSCRAGCVVWFGGNPAYTDAKQNAMLKRKAMLIDDPCLFLAVFMRYLNLKSDSCIRKGVLMSSRFNVSSDIKYERVIVQMDDIQTNFSNFAAYFIAKTGEHIDTSDLPMPYDYTKHFDRRRDLNYHLVYSVTDNDTAKAEQAIENGLPLAIVVDTKRGKPLPTTVRIGKYTLPAVDGDEHDYLPEHGREPHAVLLRYKYNAKHKAAKRKAVLDSAILSGFCKIADQIVV